MDESTLTLNPTFEKNLQVLFQINPRLMGKLFQIQTNTRFEVFQGKDLANINILDIELQSFLYANPISDTLVKAQALRDGDHVPYRYLYGIGTGVVLQMLLSDEWIESITVIEPNLEMFYISLHLFDFSEPILSRKLILEHADDFDFVKASYLISNSNAQLFAKLFKLEYVSNYYEHFYLENILHINKILIQAFETTIIGYGNSAEDTLMGIEHHIKNLPAMIEGPQLNSLYSLHYPKTAIVVSTGPSLTKQIPLLKKIKDYVTIICVDASFPILERHGIKPDFVTVLERIPETANFFKNNLPESQEGVHFICVSIAHHEVLDAIKTGTKVLQMRPHSYTHFFELHQYGYLGVGMSAANLAHEMAISLKFEQVLLIGQDLAFGRDNTSHASDHFFGVDEEKVEGHDFYVEAYGGGEEIRTTMYWNMFKSYFERAINSSKTFIQTINCTEGGARIPGAIELSFEDAIEQYVDFSTPKSLFALPNTPKDEALAHKQQIIEKINLWLQDTVNRQEVIEKAFMDIQAASENFIVLLEEGRLEEITFETLIPLMDEIDTIKAYLSEPIFKQLYYDILQSMLLHFELDFVKIEVMRVEDDDDRKAKMISWLLAHRYWLFTFAGGIDAEREIIIRAVETWSDDWKQQIVYPVKKEIIRDEVKYQELMAKFHEQISERFQIEQ
ncbi:MAG: 6-hydroxymethylpterin diphosphokinase MptE-like protein [Pseudomonadota bacterium]